MLLSVLNRKWGLSWFLRLRSSMSLRSVIIRSLSFSIFVQRKPIFNATLKPMVRISIT